MPEPFQLSKISKETVIPIGLVIMIMSGIWFLSKLDSRVQNNETKIMIIESQIKEMKDSLYSIDKNVNIITGVIQNQSGEKQ